MAGRMPWAIATRLIPLSRGLPIAAWQRLEARFLQEIRKRPLPRFQRIEYERDAAEFTALPAIRENRAEGLSRRSLPSQGSSKNRGANLSPEVSENRHSRQPIQHPTIGQSLPENFFANQLGFFALSRTGKCGPGSACAILFLNVQASSPQIVRRSIGRRPRFRRRWRQSP